MGREWVYDLQGKEIVFTGKIDGYDEHDLEKIALRLGASRIKDWVNWSTTDILVRGWSDRWKYGNFGKKEKKVAEMQSAGHRIRVIDEEGFFGLRSGLPAPSLTPNVPDSPVRANAAEGGLIGAPYRAGTFADSLQGDGEYYRDPDVMDRGLKAHSSTQDALAEKLRKWGYTPLSPFYSRCNFDLAWQLSDGSIGIVEVKSNTPENEAFQIRHGLGQVLDYGQRVKERGFSPRLFLVLEEVPIDNKYWAGLCAAHEVTLTWAPQFRRYGVTAPAC